MEAPLGYGGRGETCLGCGEIIRAGDSVGPFSEKRPDQLLCIGCWWLQACDLPLPGWSRGVAKRTYLAGVFMPDRWSSPRSL